MQFQVTRQYAREKELPLAEFAYRAHAVAFISGQADEDLRENFVRIYRLYENGQLTQEYNLNHLDITCGRAQFASGDADLPEPFAEPFRALKEQSVIAKFIGIETARWFLRHIFKNDPATYFIFNGRQFIEKVTPESIEREGQAAAQKQRVEKKARFRPAPFMTPLRMGPTNWVRDEDDDDDQNNDDKK